MSREFIATAILLALNILIAVIYICIWSINKKNFIKLFKKSALYLVFSNIMYFIIIFGNSSNILNILTIIRYYFVVISSIYFIYGIFEFINKGLRIDIRIINVIIIISSIIVMAFQCKPSGFLKVYNVFIGVATIITSIIYLKTLGHQTFYGILLNISLMFFGILVLLINCKNKIYFFSTNFCNIYSAMQLIIYLNFLFLYFENIKEEFVNIKSKLRKSENKLKGIIENQKDVILELDEHIKIDKIREENFTNLSHDLRTPLNVINSTLQVIDIYKEDNIEDQGEKLNGYLEIVNKNIYRLIKLVNNIIDISKLDSGFCELNCTYANMVEVVEDTCMLAVDYAESKNINLQFDTTEEEMYSDFDEDKIERIVLNILSNALRFTPNGGHIMVNMIKEKGYINISIKDNGIGIEKERLDSIFDKFTQIDKSNLRGTAGSGLGLSIVKSLIELHGGIIEVHSEINKGSNFIIKIPITKHSNSEKTMTLMRSKENIKIELGDI